MWGSNGATKPLMTQVETPKAIFTVLMSNGERVAHVYPIPEDDDKAIEFVDGMISPITGALTRSKPWFLFLQ
jgi:hypothetical protein